MNALKIIFIFALIVTAISSVILIKAMKKIETDKIKFIKILPYNIKTLFAMVCILFTLILAMIDTSGIYRQGFILMTVTLSIEYLLACFYIANDKKLLKFSAKLIFLLSMLELTIFNFSAYHIFIGDYEQKALNFNDGFVEIGTADIDSTENTVSISGNDEVVLTFNDLNYTIGTIHADVEFLDNTKHTKTVIDITDETSSTYRYDIAKADIVKGREMSNYITCDFSGKVTNFRIKFTNYSDSDSIKIKSVTINAPIPFEISYLRIILIGGLTLIAYAVCSVEAFREPFQKKTSLCRNFFICTTTICCILAIIIVNLNIGSNSSMLQQFKLESGNQITQELVDAFEKGQVSLLAEPSESILNFENPYDRGGRESSGAYALWDHLLYNGKYYSYYGIAPVLLLYLPYHLITGYYCSTSLSILLFSILGLIFLTMTFFAFIKKWFKNTPAGIVIAGHIILLSACGLWFSISRNIFYEISISSGFMFTTIGAYFLFTSNVIGEGKISLVRTFLSSLFLAVSVLCRPTLAVYCICACVYFAYGFFKKDYIPQGSETVSKPVKKSGFLICALVPFVVLGSVQMWYNYIRFGSPLDFGIQYSLTINDFTHSQYHTIFVFISLFNYLFAMPKFSTEYPFISTSYSNLQANGFYFSDEGNTSGIFFLALPVFAYLLSWKVLKKLDKKSKIKSLLLVGLPCVIMPLIIIFSIWESGYAVRYTADFSWEMILGAYAILFYLYSKSKDNTKKEFLRKFMAFSMICAIIINGIQIFSFAFDSYYCSVFGKEYYPEICWSMEHLFTFWK